MMPMSSHAFARQHFGDAEIRDLGAPVSVTRMFAGFQIAVDHFVPMRVIQPFADLPD